MVHQVKELAVSPVDLSSSQDPHKWVERTSSPKLSLDFHIYMVYTYIHTYKINIILQNCLSIMLSENRLEFWFIFHCCFRFCM